VTLEANTEAFYFVDEFYSPELGRGIRWNDPRFGIEWPVEPVVVSEKDRGHRDFDPAYHLRG
jgi:dTDP-4-dehydrorhamnose 3,5-epimerase